MHEQPYADKGWLQQLLAECPGLLAGDQIDETAPHRWLLISREFGVPLEEEAATRRRQNDKKTKGVDL